MRTNKKPVDFTFRITGRTTKFKAVMTYNVLSGTCACVQGIASINGKLFLTNARLADIIKE